MACMTEDNNEVQMGSTPEETSAPEAVSTEPAMEPAQNEGEGGKKPSRINLAIIVLIAVVVMGAVLFYSSF